VIDPSGTSGAVPPPRGVSLSRVESGGERAAVGWAGSRRARTLLLNGNQAPCSKNSAGGAGSIIWFVWMNAA
jgi:hypothetical protein